MPARPPRNRRGDGVLVIHDAGLRERNYGAFEGRTFAEVERDFPAEYERFHTRDPDYVPPGGESAVQFRDRVMAALERIAAGATGKHGAAIRSPARASITSATPPGAGCSRPGATSLTFPPKASTSSSVG